MLLILIHIDCHDTSYMSLARERARRGQQWRVCRGRGIREREYHGKVRIMSHEETSDWNLKRCATQQHMNIQYISMQHIYIIITWQHQHQHQHQLL